MTFQVIITCKRFLGWFILLWARAARTSTLRKLSRNTFEIKEIKVNEPFWQKEQNLKGYIRHLLSSFCSKHIKSNADMH